jgi:hypothetical protein
VTYGGSTGTAPTYVTPTYFTFGREDWEMKQGPKDGERIGNSIIPVGWKMQIDVHLPCNCWQGDSVTPTFTTAGTGDTDINYSGYTNRVRSWAPGAPFQCHLFLGRPKSAPTTAKVSNLNVSDIAWQRFFQSASSGTTDATAAALTGQILLLDRPFVISDHWEIKKRWKFVLTPELFNATTDYEFNTTNMNSGSTEQQNFGQSGALKHMYPSMKSIKIDLTKYLPKRITYDDADFTDDGSTLAPPTNLPGNVKPLILFLVIYPKSTYTASRYQLNGDVDVDPTMPTVPWTSGTNIAAYVAVKRTVTWMDP